MPRIEKRVTPKQMDDWKEFCQKQGVNGSQMLGLILEKMVGETFQKVPVSCDAKTVQVSIRLSSKNAEKMTSTARREGFPSRTTWLNALVLSALHHHPVFSDLEINTLRHSNRETAAIGRNLNQITKVLNTDFRAADNITKDMVETLRQAIEQHHDKVVSLLNKSLDRWEVNE